MTHNNNNKYTANNPTKKLLQFKIVKITTKLVLITLCCKQVLSKTFIWLKETKIPYFLSLCYEGHS